MTDTTNELVDCPDCGGKLKRAREIHLIVLDEYNNTIDTSSTPCVVCVDCGTVYYDPEKYAIGYIQTCETCKFGAIGKDGKICKVAPPWTDPSILDEDWQTPNTCVNFKKMA